MNKIIPAINCHNKDWDCVLKKIKTAEEFSKDLHIDIADGVFTFNKSWNDPEKWKELGKSVSAEVHIMFDRPENEFEKWLDAGASKIIFHWEAVRDDMNSIFSRDTDALIKRIINKCEEYGAKAIVAVNPETPVSELEKYFERFNRFHILSVHPGPPGQSFIPVVLDKVRFLKKELKNALVSVDGGINLENAKEAKEAGADILVSGTYIFGSSNPRKAFDELTNI